MTDPLDQIIACQQVDEIVGRVNAAMPSLSKSDCRRFNFIKLSYLSRYGEVGAFERMNNKTIATIIDEFDQPDAMEVVETGERDGLRYEILRMPSEESLS